MSPLQLKIDYCPLIKAKQLNRLWHSILPDYETGFMPISVVCFSAEYKNIYYAVAIWNNPSSPSLVDKKYLELRRMAIAQDAPKNTASRMLKIMTQIIKKEYAGFEKLISYQDTSVHTGTIYKASGWVIGSISKGGQKMYGKHREVGTGQKNAPKIRWEKQIRQEKPHNKPFKNDEQREQLSLFTS